MGVVANPPTPYSIQKRPKPWERVGPLQNRKTQQPIVQTYTKNTQKNRIWGIFLAFSPYSASGAIFLFSRGPTFSQPEPQRLFLKNDACRTNLGSSRLESQLATLTLPVLPFLIFFIPCFSPCKDFLLFWERVSLFFRNFGGSVGIKHHFLGWSCLPFQKKERKDRAVSRAYKGRGSRMFRLFFLVASRGGQNLGFCSSISRQRALEKV